MSNPEYWNCMGGACHELIYPRQIRKLLLFNKSWKRNVACKHHSSNRGEKIQHTQKKKQFDAIESFVLFIISWLIFNNLQEEEPIIVEFLQSLLPLLRDLLSSVSRWTSLRINGSSERERERIQFEDFVSTSQMLSNHNQSRVLPHETENIL